MITISVKKGGLLESSSPFIQLDTFEDTSVSCNYEPTSIDNILESSVPYTNSFSLPLTEKNKSAIGFNELTGEFECDDLIAKVFSDGDIVLFGFVNLSDVTINTLNAVFSVQIIDIMSYILNKGEDMRLGEIFKSGELDSIRMLHASSINTKNELYEFSGINMTGFNGDGFEPIYIHRIKDESGIPIMFNLKELLINIFKIFGLSLNEKYIPYDLTFNDIVITLPIEYKSRKKKIQSIHVRDEGHMAGMPIATRFLDSEVENKYNNIKNREILSSGCDFNLVYLQKYGENAESLVSTVSRFNTYVSKINKNVVFNPSIVSVNNIGNSIAITVGLITRKMSLDAKKGLEMWLYICDSYGATINRFKMGDIFISGSTRTFTKTNDYLFADATKLIAGQVYSFRIAMHATVPIYEGDIVFFGNTISLGKNGLIADIPSAKLISDMELDLDIESVDSFNEYDITEPLALILNKPQKISPDEFVNNNSDDIYYIDMMESLNNVDVTISGFIKDFCSRFNIKINSDGNNVILSSSSSSNNDLIDLSGRLNGEVKYNEQEDQDKYAKEYSLENASGDLFRDTFFDKTTFGSTRKNSLKTKNISSVRLNSALMMNKPTGKIQTSQSDDITNLLNKYSQEVLGVTNTEPISISGMGIRYGYRGSTKSVVPYIPIISSEQDLTIQYQELYTPDSIITYSPGFNAPTYVSELGGVVALKPVIKHSNGFVEKFGICGVGKALHYKGIIFMYDFVRVGNFDATSETFFCGVDNGFPSEINNTQFVYGLSYLPNEQGVLRNRNNDTSFEFIPAEHKIKASLFGYFNRNDLLSNTLFDLGLTTNIGTAKTSDKLCVDYLISLPIQLEVKSDDVFTIRTGSNTNPYAVPFSYKSKKFFDNASTSDFVMQTVLTDISEVRTTNTGVDTLAFDNSAYVEYKNITNAYDRYFKSTILSISKKRGSIVEADFYLTSSEIRSIMNGCRIMFNGDEYILLNMSDADITNNYGGICKIKMCKLK